MNFKSYSDKINSIILINIRNRMRSYFNPDQIQESDTFEAYIKPWDKTEPEKDFLIVEDEKGEIVGWGGLFKSSSFGSSLGLFIPPNYISSSLPILLVENLEKIAKAQNLTNLSLYVYSNFSVLLEALNARGTKIQGADYVLVAWKPKIVPSFVIPDIISLKSSIKAEWLLEYAETVNSAFRQYPSWQDINEKDIIQLEEDLSESGFNQTIHFYAFVKEKLVGILHTGIQDSDISKKRGEIIRLGVIPEYRRMKIANALFGSAIHWLWNKNCSKIELSVLGKNENALKLYRNWGFTELKEKTIYIYILRPQDEV